VLVVCGAGGRRLAVLVAFLRRALSPPPPAAPSGLFTLLRVQDTRGVRTWPPLPPPSMARGARSAPLPPFQRKSAAAAALRPASPNSVSI